MTNQIGIAIINLLKAYECVVLPEFGALLLQDKPAYIAAGQIFPANKTIRFNKNIRLDDDLLTAALVYEKNVAYLEAKNEINIWINQLIFDLNQKGYYDINHLGRFQKNENEIVFIPSSQQLHLNIHTYGFEPLAVQTISRAIIADTKPPQKIAIKYVQKRNSLKRNRSLIGFTTSLLVVGILSIFFIKQKDMAYLKIQNAHILEFLVPSKQTIDRNFIYTNTVQEKTLPSAKTVRAFENPSFDDDDKTKKAKKKASENKPDIIIDDNHVAIPETTTVSAVTTLKEEEFSPKKTTLTEEILEPNLAIMRLASENEQGYYIITGAYSSLSNANKAKYECSLENNCSIFNVGNGMYRVGFFVSKNRNEAVRELLNIKKSNSNYWLMESFIP